MVYLGVIGHYGGKKRRQMRRRKGERLRKSGRHSRTMKRLGKEFSWGSLQVGRKEVCSRENTRTRVKKKRGRKEKILLRDC